MHCFFGGGLLLLLQVHEKQSHWANSRIKACISR